ncbi:MAG: ferric reductase-like transmembrane domain-containing protein [Chloroflexi bacterium]|nr:ferric reductase-like transmembrane domain-containing protein [Chloroflexota bacterium]
MENESNWIDNVSLVFSLLVIGLAGGWLVYSGTFENGIITSDNLIWHLIRSAGIASYILLTLSVLWGLALSSSVVKSWSPGPLTMVLHSTISWLSLVLALIHGLLLLVDKYFSYQVTDIFVPFTGPYRAFATGLGTLAFWILVIVTPSFALKKRFFSHRVWKTLHYLSYAAFMLVTAHGLMAGTDAPNVGFQLLFGISVLLTLILLGYRIGVKQAAAKAKPAHARSQPPARTAADAVPDAPIIRQRATPSEG